MSAEREDGGLRMTGAGSEAGVPCAVDRAAARIVRFALLGLTVGLLSGCFCYGAGRVTDEPGKRLPAEIWAARDLEVVRPFLKRTPERIDGSRLPHVAHERDGADAADPKGASSNMFERTLRYTIESAQLRGNGLLRVYTNHLSDPEDPLSLIALGFVPNAAFLTSREVESSRFQRRLDETSDSDNAFLEEGMQLHLQRELPDEPRGTLIYFTAMLGNDYERRVIESLRERGWVILAISTRSRINPPQRPEYAERIAELASKVARLRRLAEEELVHLLRDPDIPTSEYRAAVQADENAQAAARLNVELMALHRGSFQVCEERSVEPVAREIAAQVDDLLAEHAYAAEAALDFAHEAHPELAELPTAVIGFSAGSLVAPAAAVRLIDHIDAVVLIGAGANFMRIVQDSDQMDGGLRIRCGDDPVPAALMAQLEQRYLEFVRLDPYQLAPHLRHKPVLLVRAVFDAWVPASAGRLLRDRLGSPSRLTHFGGHGTLFYFLPGQATRIARWLDDVVTRD